MKVEAPKCLITNEKFSITPRLLMGPGPSNASERVLKCLAEPVIGPFHSEILDMMEDVKEGIRYVFQTKNPIAFCVSGAGTSAMEAAFANLIEPGDVVLILVTGFWGQRAVDIAQRCGGEVRELKVKEWGTTLSLESITEAIELHRPAIVFAVHADSSTGVHQRMEGIGPVCRKYNALLIVDVVASAGGMDVLVDDWQVDLMYGGAQKCIGALVGLSPITMNERCLKKIDARKTKPLTYYLDLVMNAQYWLSVPGRQRIYHHTICSNLLYALREAMREICEEGLETAIARHEDVGKYLREKLAESNYEFFVENPDDRLTTVTAIKIPNGCEFFAMNKYAKDHFAVEISPGLGPTVGLVLRIGVMRNNATRENVDKFMRGLNETVKHFTKGKN